MWARSGASLGLGQAAKSAKKSAPEFCTEITSIFQCLEFGTKLLNFGEKVGAGEAALMFIAE
jgi:hypothetical protein